MAKPPTICPADCPVCAEARAGYWVCDECGQPQPLGATRHYVEGIDAAHLWALALLGPLCEDCADTKIIAST